MDKRKMKKLLILNLPYFLVGLFATNLGEAWRLAEGADSSAKILSFFNALPIALNNPLPSFHPLDLLIGILCGAGLRLAVYLKGKNAKKYRHNVEYGSARWGTAKDIEPFIAPKFEDNVILTKTERLMMSNRPKNPANPYVWGGSSPSTSFDCSGFVSWVINNCGNGWSVGRQTANGLKNLCDIIPPSEAKPGDLIFFQGTYNTSGASHVGIYVGNGMMIHCGDPISYASIETNYWQQHFYCFGRIP